MTDSGPAGQEWLSMFAMPIGDQRFRIVQLRAESGEIAIGYWSGSIWAKAPVRDDHEPLGFAPVAHRFVPITECPVCGRVHSLGDLQPRETLLCQCRKWHLSIDESMLVVDFAQQQPTTTALTPLDGLKVAQSVFQELSESSREELTIARCKAAVSSIGNIVSNHQASPSPADFQTGVHEWMMACFGAEIAGDLLERADRFTEEALELVQTMPGFTAERAHALVDYVFGRDVGERGQEVGGVMVTLAALCNPVELNIKDEAERELARIWTKVDAIRAKQAAKPTGSALPIAHPEGHANGR